MFCKGGDLRMGQLRASIVSGSTVALSRPPKVSYSGYSVPGMTTVEDRLYFSGYMLRRMRLGTRAGTRCLACRDQVILVLRWL